MLQLEVPYIMVFLSICPTHGSTITIISLNSEIYNFVLSVGIQYHIQNCIETLAVSYIYI